MGELSWWRDRWLRILVTVLLVVAVVIAVGMARRQNADANRLDVDKAVCQLAPEDC